MPFELRLPVVLLLRRLGDRRNGIRFARERRDASEFPHVICSYERPFIDYPGQEQVATAKRRNQAILAEQLDGVALLPGEVFSVWRLAGRPSERKGYARASAIKNGELTMEVGGATCLLSTVLYNVGLLGALEIVERHCHSIDLYGDGRYFDLGRDASIEYGYLDLRLRNPHPFPVRLGIEVDESRVAGSLHAAQPAGFAVEIDVGWPRVIDPGMRTVFDTRLDPGEQRLLSPGKPGIEVAGVRRVVRATGTMIEVLPPSFHHPVPGVMAVADGFHAPADPDSLPPAARRVLTGRDPVA